MPRLKIGPCDPISFGPLFVMSSWDVSSFTASRHVSRPSGLNDFNEATTAELIGVTHHLSVYRKHRE